MKVTNYDKTKKMAHDSQIVRANKKLKLSYGRPSQQKHQASTNGLKLYVRDLGQDVRDINHGSYNQACRFEGTVR